MYDSKEIAKRIKTVARLKMTTVKDILENCELAINTVSKISNGSDIFSLNLAKIADYLDVSVDYLLGRTDKRDGHKT